MIRKREEEKQHKERRKSKKWVRDLWTHTQSEEKKKEDIKED
jgi:hypothetical protein